MMWWQASISCGPSPRYHSPYIQFFQTLSVGHRMLSCPFEIIRTPWAMRLIRNLPINIRGNCTIATAPTRSKVLWNIYPWIQRFLPQTFAKYQILLILSLCLFIKFGPKRSRPRKVEQNEEMWWRKSNLFICLVRRWGIYAIEPNTKIH